MPNRVHPEGVRHLRYLPHSHTPKASFGQTGPWAEAHGSDGLQWGNRLGTREMVLLNLFGSATRGEPPADLYELSAQQHNKTTARFPKNEAAVITPKW